MSAESSTDSSGISLVKLPQKKKKKRKEKRAAFLPGTKHGSSGIFSVHISSGSEEKQKGWRGLYIPPLQTERISETCKIILMTALSEAFQCLSMTQNKKKRKYISLSRFLKPAHAHSLFSGNVSLSSLCALVGHVLVKRNKKKNVSWSKKTA